MHFFRPPQPVFTVNFCPNFGLFCGPPQLIFFFFLNIFKGLFQCISSDHHSPFLQSIFALILAFCVSQLSSFIFYFSTFLKGLFQCIFSDHHSLFLQPIFALILAFFVSHLSSFFFFTFLKTKCRPPPENIPQRADFEFDFFFFFRAFFYLFLTSFWPFSPATSTKFFNFFVGPFPTTKDQGHSRAFSVHFSDHHRPFLQPIFGLFFIFSPLILAFFVGHLNYFFFFYGFFISHLKPPHVGILWSFFGGGRGST